ncbi:hypothetical protein ACP4OV_024816 [Aristida adscensionis]
MAAFNRHWPSMFRSKHAGQPWDAPQPVVTGGSPPSLLSGGSSTTTTGCSLRHPSSGGEERTPDPKPRWNPKPEQIRILEAIFNSGMVNPPREEIPRIRMRLQEYGPVGDANVFYWFQNRKSRSKNRLRTATGRGAAAARAPPPPPPRSQPVQHLLASPVQAPTSSSSSSSDRSSGSSKPAATAPAAEGVSAAAAAAAMDLLGPLAVACPQMYYQGHPVAAPAPKVKETAAADEPALFPWPQGYCLSAAEVAAILAPQCMHVPVHQQPSALPAGMFLGLCNDVVAPPTAITGHRSCAGWGVGLGQSHWPACGADHHQLGKNAPASNAGAAREVAHDDATKLGLLQYGAGISTAMDGAPAAATLPLAASPDAAVTVVASVAAPTAGLAGLAASTVGNGVVANYDHQLQGLAEGTVGVVTAAADARATAPPPAPARAVAADEGGVAVLCITDATTGASVVHYDVPAAKLDVRTLFGAAAMLCRYAAGDRLEHVPVDDASGFTVEPLQHGGVYYVLV